MAERRRTSRYIVPEAAEALLAVLEDVFIERMSGEAICVLSCEPVGAGEEVVLELSAGRGRRVALTGSVRSSTPLALDGRRYRITVGINDGGNSQEEIACEDASASIGILTRRVAVRVRDVSTSGCLLDCTRPLQPGAIGVLELTVNGLRQSETLRVCRTTRFSGSSWPYRAGAEFLALNAPPSTSVRNVVARFEVMNEVAALPESIARVHRRGTSAVERRRPARWSGLFDEGASPADSSY